MKNIDQYPKALKKAIRYIKQDAPQEQLDQIKELINNAIEKRERVIKKTS